ncbi:MAG: hypothetical protein ACMZI0_12505 [Symbiopectobacterium sp.]|uniref:hypothetical protein n=1 Tax=Symbiopectobacterium sp. TaxID=2952789 RepID=UPI0039ED6039
MSPDFCRSAWLSCVWQGRSQANAIASQHGVEARLCAGILWVKCRVLQRDCVIGGMNTFEEKPPQDAAAKWMAIRLSARRKG